MASSGGPLLYRIQRLAGVTSKEYGPSRLPALLAVSLGVICFALNVTWVRAQDAAGVKVDLGSSSVIHRPPVPYPEAALKQGLTGTVQVEVKLDAAGNVADARVLSGPEELRKASLESVLNWHFTSDAARGTRLISISFSERGKQVQVREPQKAQAVTLEGNKAAVNFAADEKFKLLDELKFKMAEAQAAEVRRTEEEAKILIRRQQLEKEMAAVKMQIEQASRNEEKETAGPLTIRLAEMQKEFNETPLTQRKIGPVVMASRVVKRINTADLPDSVSNDLLARLPVREGDILSQDSIEQTAKAIRAFDEHLRVQLRATDDGQVEIRIVVPR